MDEPQPKVLRYRAQMLAPQFSMLIDASLSAPLDPQPGDEPPITIEEIKAEKAALENLGFMFDNKNWNDYVCCLAQLGELDEACKECEANLMQGWIRRGRFSIAHVTGMWKLKRERKVRLF